MRSSRFVKKIASIEAGAEAAHVVAKVKLLEDVALHALVRGGGHRDDRHGGKPFPKDRETTIVFAKVMSPLADAVRLVDCEERQPKLAEQCEKAIEHETFGSKIK